MAEKFSFNLILPTFPQQDAQNLSGASRASVNNWLGRGYLQLSRHPKAEAMGKRFSFYDVLKLKVMWQLSRLKVQPKFAAEVGDLVTARASMLQQRGEKTAQDPLEILLALRDTEVEIYLRFPTKEYFDLREPYLVLPCDRLFYGLFQQVHDSARSEKLKDDISLVQSAYTDAEIEAIRDAFLAFMSPYQEKLEDAFSSEGKFSVRFGE
jgi:hypothetical protein